MLAAKVSGKKPVCDNLITISPSKSRLGGGQKFGKPRDIRGAFGALGGGVKTLVKY